MNAGSHELRCGTRALKNARYLQRHAPQTLPATEVEDGFGTGIPMHVLARLHRLPHDHPDLKEHEQVAAFLRTNRPPRPTGHVRGRLFHGRIHVAQVTFKAPQRSFVIPNADMATIAEYARHAIVPISEYAKQYGPNSARVSPTVIEYTATLSTTSYGDRMVQSWVNEIAARNSLPKNSCVVVVSPRGLRAQNVAANAGYHGIADIPYTVLGVHASGLTLEDQDDAYAMVVSHELAELVVDPGVDGTNPEVCDPCDLNCGPLHRCYFDSADNYLGSTPSLPPPFAFSYYICAIVKPAAAARCPASAANCNYAP